MTPPSRTTRRRTDNLPYDIDMRMERDEKGGRYLHKAGTPYPGSER
jgi:hypothetical protein